MYSEALTLYFLTQICYSYVVLLSFCWNIYSLYLIELDRILFKHIFDIIVGFNGLLSLEYIYLHTGKFCKQKPNLFYDESWISKTACGFYFCFWCTTILSVSRVRHTSLFVARYTFRDNIIIPSTHLIIVNANLSISFQFQLIPNSDEINNYR